MRRAVLAIVLGVLGAGSAEAHTFEPALLDLRERDPGVFDVVWQPPGKESGAVMPGEPELVPRLPADCRQLADLSHGLAHGLAGGLAKGLGDDELRGDGHGDGSRLGAGEERTAFRVDCGPGRLRGATIAVPGIAGSRVDAIVRLTWNDGHAVSGVLRSDGEEFVVPEGPSGGFLLLGAPARTVAGRYLALGIAHILHGSDHVLFVIGLFLLVGATPALVATISAFTLAHSLTLAAAVLGLVHVPAAPVEALIALSIVLLARELVRTGDEPPTLARRLPWAMAFLFGLLHGLGFAGALAETGVPADQIPLALVAFNLGVEAGQLMIVAALVVAAMALRRVLAPTHALRWLPPYVMGTLAVAWMIERVLAFWRPSA